MSIPEKSKTTSRSSVTHQGQERPTINTRTNRLEYLKKHPNGPYPRYTTPVGEESLVQPQFAQAADINNVVAKAISTGLPYSSSEGTERKAVFGDFTKVKDYQASLNQVVLAEEAFDELPAIARKRFHGNPQEFLEFMDDSKNLEEARKLGLVETNFGETNIEKIKKEQILEMDALKKQKKSEEPNEE